MIVPLRTLNWNLPCGEKILLHVVRGCSSRWWGAVLPCGEKIILYFCFEHVFVVCHDQVRRQGSQGSCCRGSWTDEAIPPDSAINPQVTSPSGVRCKWTSVSHLVVKLHNQYRCRLVCRTPCAYSPAVDGSVLIVTVRECWTVLLRLSIIAAYLNP